MKPDTRSSPGSKPTLERGNRCTHNDTYQHTFTPLSTGTASGTPAAAQVTVGDRVTNRRNDP